MDEFHVEIKFPARNAEDRSLVVVSGREEDVADCVDHLRSLEDEYVNGLRFPFNEFLHLKCFDTIDFVFCIWIEVDWAVYDHQLLLLLKLFLALQNVNCSYFNEFFY